MTTTPDDALELELEGPELDALEMIGQVVAIAAELYAELVELFDDAPPLRAFERFADRPELGPALDAIELVAREGGFVR